VKPTAALDLAFKAAEAGWGVAFKPGADSGGSKFVEVKGFMPGTGDRSDRKFTVTWHTRDTGTYRLFSCLISDGWTRAVTLKKLHEFIEHIEAS